MQKTAVINVVGLTSRLVGEHTPFLKQWIDRGQSRTIRPVFPAVTCTAQSTYLTGTMPDEHGIVANGWYFRDMDEIKFWRQSNRLVQAEKIWEKARREDPSFTCANLFWWYNMNSTVDYLVTPRPIYRADGLKIPDILTDPPELRDTLQQELGQFPLFEFWGPMTTVRSSRWIAESAKKVTEMHDPTLSLVYLPHLDYNLQRLGPDDAAIATDLREIDMVCRDLVNWYEQRGVQVVILSEYGITPVSREVSLNRVLRKNGYITVRDELGGEILIPGSSRAFAVADHQVAHVYVRRSADVDPVRRLLEQVPGVEQVLGEQEMRDRRLWHARAGELLVVAQADAWFTYYYWLDDRKAPDFAPTVDIHNKPGYDPAELLVDPALRMPRARAALRLLQKKLGMRYRMDLIPLHGQGVKGSHGRVPDQMADWPLVAVQSGLQKVYGGPKASGDQGAVMEPADIHDLIYSLVFESQ